MLPAGSLPVPLDAPQDVLLAEPKAAKGIYTQEIAVTVLIPGGTIPGRYVGEMIVTVAVRL
jgi:hypothetical protein